MCTALHTGGMPACFAHKWDFLMTKSSEWAISDGPNLNNTIKSE